VYRLHSPGGRGGGGGSDIGSSEGIMGNSIIMEKNRNLCQNSNNNRICTY
jgi:hypothetical protein